jgi:outer membrane receptor protein involved in Fe transport
LGLVWSVFVTSAGGTEPAGVLSADIAPRPVSEALAAFEHQTGLQLIYVSSVAEAQRSKGAPAGLTAPAALEQLLDGTGLTFEFLNERTVRIYAAPAIVPTLTAASPPAPHAVRQAPHAAGLEEVIVSGARGQEPLSRVPIDMAVWTADAMEASHVQGIAQIAALTPGVDFGFSPTTGDVYTDLIIRGVDNRHGAAIGVLVDGSPIPPSRNATYLLTFPVTFDLERVEILRGPQTVLLGDHAISGAVRFITNQPSLTAFTSLLHAELGATEYGGMSYEAGAAVGGPLRTDVLGFRVSGWFREDGGYVDRVNPLNTNATLDADSNRSLHKVVRGALTLAPTAGLQLTSSLSYQSVYSHDPSVFDTDVSDPAHGVFKNPSLLQQPFEETVYLASLKLTARLRGAELSALASYFDQNGTLLVNTFPVPPTDQTLFGLEQQAHFAELRLTSPDPDSLLTWVAGASVSSQRARHPVSEPGGTFFPIHDVVDVEQTQLAGFGQIALKLTKRLSASAGVWIGHSKHDSVDEFSSPRYAHISDTGTAPRFELSWQADQRNLIYLIIAKGYGSGGMTPQPLPYPPDTLWSYEIGSKHGLFDGRLRLETSLFHIDWDNGPPESYTVNFAESQPVPGKAVSNGFGVTAQALVGDHAKAALSVAYTDAHLAQTLELDGKLFVQKGDSLPVSPWNVTASIEREFHVGVDVTASVRAEDAFRSAVGRTYQDRPDTPAYSPSLTDSSANVLNLRAAVRWPHFEAAAFLTNALGSHPIQSGKSGGVVLLGAPMAMTLVPRTLSVSGTWRF